MQSFSNAPGSHAPTSQFRADVEGLRAIAVLLVVADHAKVPGFAAGFIGVDVFFVLSGFLITRLLVQERATTGSIDLPRFYARRFRRLMPALALMLVITMGLASLLLTPSEQIKASGAALAASLWLSNVHFALDESDYFGPAVESNPFLHTWSLGVEEQFYLVWPVLILLALQRVGPGHRRLRVLMSAVLIASAAGCLWISHSSAGLAFFLTPFRAWQFAAGALVFLALEPRFTRSPSQDVPGTSKSSANLLVAAGTALLLIALLLIDGQSVYPGAWAVLPTAATALLLYVHGRRTDLPSFRLLASPPMQWVGRHSYAWYLWHWPVLVLGAAVVSTESLGVRLLLVGFALVLAAISYAWVESPFRHLRGRLSGTRISLALASATTLGLVICVMTWLSSIDRREAEFIGTRELEKPELYAHGCDSWISNADLNPCWFGDDAAPRTLALIGDSIGMHWFPALQKSLDPMQWRILVLTKSSCSLVDEPFFYERIRKEFTLCAEWRDKALAYLEELEPDLIVAGASHTYEYSDEQWAQGSERVLARLSEAGDRVAIIRSTPVLPFDAHACAGARSAFHAWMASESRCTFELAGMDEARERVHRLMQQAAASFDNLQLIDLTDLVCPGNVCSARRNGTLVFSDTQHLNGRFVQALAPDIVHRLGLEQADSPGKRNKR
jgi:peptidoglycan/LPS O-acetylase OafA/YrhL